MVELDGRVVGCCALLKHSDNAYEVSKMAVMREYRGAGIGKRLLRAVIEHARLIGARRLEMEDRVQLPRLCLAWITPPLFAGGDAELDLLSHVLTSGKSAVKAAR